MPEEDYDEILQTLKSHLEDGIESLRDCIDEYNTKRDHEKCAMKLRRESAEILYEIPHDIGRKGKMYPYTKAYKEFLIEKSGTGTENISRETIEGNFYDS